MSIGQAYLTWQQVAFRRVSCDIFAARGTGVSCGTGPTLSPDTNREIP